MANKKFGEILRELRNSTGLTQQQVADLLELKNKSTLGSWEVGKSEPDAYTLLKLCKIYNVKNIYEAFGEVTPTAINKLDKQKKTKEELLNNLLKNEFNLDDKNCNIIQKYIKLSSVQKSAIINLVYSFSTKKEIEKKYPIYQVPARGSKTGHFEIEMTEEMQKGFEEDLNYDNSNNDGLY